MFVQHPQVVSSHEVQTLHASSSPRTKLLWSTRWLLLLSFFAPLRLWCAGRFCACTPLSGASRTYLRRFSVSSLGAPVAPPASCLGVPSLLSLFSGLCFASTGRRRPYRPPVLLRSTSPLHGSHIEVNFFVGSLFGSFTVTRFRGAGFPVQSIQVCWSGSCEVLIERDDCFRGR